MTGYQHEEVIARYPTSIAGLAVTAVRDLTKGFDSSNPPSYQPSLPLSSGHMIQFSAKGADDLKVYLTIRFAFTAPRSQSRVTDTDFN